VSHESDLDRVAAILERAASWLRRTTRPAEWSAVALSTLDAVARTGPTRITDLVALEHITQPGMTGLVGRLESADLVVRRPDPNDGRATLVEISAAGRAYLDGLHAQRAANIAAHLRTLAPADLAALADAADALARLTAQPITGEDPRS
jgi:DNA-binding MarR family transcriptional regulator